MVENIAIADTAQADNWVESDIAGIGWKYVDGVFIEPPIPSAPPATRVISKLEYMNRFTDAELIGIYTAAKTNVAVEVWLEKFKQAQNINLDDPQIRAGLDALVGGGLLAPDRPASILAL